MKIEKTSKFDDDLSTISENAPPALREIIKQRFKDFIKCKKQGIPLPADYKDHKLNNNRRFKNCRDAHLKGDIVVIYQEGGGVVKLLRVGNHNNLLENLLRG